MAAKTNAARILDAAGIHYELREYTVDEDDLSAPRVAEKIGMPPEQVFKTLVARGDRTGVLIGMHSGEHGARSESAGGCQRKQESRTGRREGSTAD